MNYKLQYQFADYLEFHGNAEQVMKQVNHCAECGAKMLLSHMPDYKNYIIQETSRCLDCGLGSRQAIYLIN